MENVAVRSVFPHTLCTVEFLLPLLDSFKVKFWNAQQRRDKTLVFLDPYHYMGKNVKLIRRVGPEERLCSSIKSVYLMRMTERLGQVTLPYLVA